MTDQLLKQTIEHVKEILGSELEEMTVTRGVLGLFFTGVKLSTGNGGLCFTPIKEIPEAVCCPSSAKAMPLSGKLAGRKVTDYLDDIFSENILKRTLGIAALNALSAHVWERQKSQYPILTGKDSFDELVIQPEKKTVVVGALVPMLKRLKKEGAPYTVLEQDSRTLKGDELKHFAPAEDAAKYVPEADLLVITGTTILNGSLEGLLEMRKPGAEIIVTGPTASMLPEAYFDAGVTHLGGILVTKPDELLDVIAEGGSGYHFFGKSAERLVILKK